MDNIFDLIDKTALEKDCEYLRSNAELGFELVRTKAYVKKALQSMGIESSECGKCGISAVIGKSELKRTVLLRADMDALPDEKAGAIHACGHHMHTAMLLGAARVIKQHEDRLKSRVKLMFQSAEEILMGAKDMIDSGILENPKVDAAFMLHVASGVDYPTGTLVFASPGEIAPSADYFEIEVSGSASHGAEPSLSRDPILSGAHIISSLSAVTSRELSLGSPAVLTLGFVKGGEAHNAIPSFLVMGGTMRAYDESTREFVKKRIGDIASLSAQALRTKAELRFLSGCPAFKNDGNLLESMVALAKQLLGEDKVIELESGQRGGGSEDFAYISRQVPTAMALLNSGCRSDGYKYPLHHPKVEFDKKALPVGSAFMAYLAFNL